jgi:tetratricopeptide (TPR) repeat protein
MAVKKKTGFSADAEGSGASESTGETQLQVFDRASKLFRAQRFAEARVLFELAAQGLDRALAHNARLHINMCDRRLGTKFVLLTTLDDLYNYGVQCLNARDLENARKHLDQAVALSRVDGDAADHVYYALAAVQALSGDARGAYENLKRAIEINPRNRAAARQDADFASVSQQPLLRQIIHPDKPSPF